MTQAAIVTNGTIMALYGAGNDKASLSGSHTDDYIATLYDVPDDVGVGYTWDGFNWIPAVATIPTIDPTVYASIVEEAVESANQLVSAAVTAESTSRTSADAALQAQLDSLTKSIPVQNETGTSYAVLSSDQGDLITFNNGSPVAVTLPEAGGAIVNGWYVWLTNLGAGTVTVTPTVSTINGAASIAIATDETLLAVSNGTNYFGAFISSGGVSSLEGRSGAVQLQASDRASSALNIDSETSHGDSDYTILATDRVVVTSAALTGPRTWTLPAANAVNAGQILVVADQAQGVTATNTLTIARAGADTINGAASYAAMAYAGAAIILWSDGSSKWVAVTIDQMSSAGQVLVTAANAAAQRTALGVGTANSPQFAGIELGHATDTTLSRASAGQLSVEGVNVIMSGGALGTPASGTLTNCGSLPVSGITASTSTALGVGSIELGHATDTTLSRSSAGVLAVEGVAVALNATTDTHTAGSIELGHATDTTLTRSSAGVLAVEGVTVPLNSTSSTHTASTIELGHASDTTLSRSSAGVLAVEGVTVSLNSTSATHTAGTLELGAASDTTLSRSAAGELAVEGTVVKKVGKETIWIPAVAMYARTTNGPASGTVEKATNKNMFKTLDFDTTTQEFAQFEIHMPKSWNLSTVTFQPVWTHASTTVNFGVVWALQGVARSDTDAGDVAFGTEQTSTDTGGTTDAIYIGPESSAITIGGTPAAGDTVQFQVKRNPANASDTMAIDARLHGIRLFFTTNASTDA